MTLTQIADNQAHSFEVPDVIAKQLVRFLEDQIIFGDLTPGERLVEEDIVARFNISRSPVREALRALEQEGLVARASRRGVRVSHMSLTDLDEVYSCRIVMEGLATELAAKNRTNEDMHAIMAAIDSLALAHRNEDLRAFFQQNILLSQNIHSAAANKTLKRLLGSIGKQSFRYRFLAYSKAPEMMLASIEGHREIAIAIEKNNARHARILMEDLIQRSWEVIRKVFL